SIPTCILVFQKFRKHTDNILFIDASQHFEKVGNQNSLRKGDIEKIITTYRERKTEAKHSHVAPISEVKENDYNLNIPRYVDTFEEEEKIDLSAVSEALVALELDIKSTDAEIENYCKQLGIKAPF